MKRGLTLGSANAPEYRGGSNPKKYLTWLVKTIKAAPVVKPLTKGRDKYTVIKPRCRRPIAA